MDTRALERELIRWRTGAGEPGENVEHLSIEDALAFRNAGNLPDEHGRTLRLVLHVPDEDALSSLDVKRASFEPDYLEPPTWRIEGSKPVNVVPLRPSSVKGTARPWWEEPRTADLEQEWSRTGVVEGLRIPAGYRSFVFKTIVALRDAEKEVTIDSICGAVARWLTPEQTEEIRAALREANA